MPATTSEGNLRRGYAYAALVMIIWTGFVLVSRMGGKSSLTAYDVIALRYAIAALVVFPLWLHHRPRLLEWRKLVLMLVGALAFTLLAFNGFRHAPANHAAILLQGFLPFSVALMAYILTGERPTRQRLWGLSLIALGVGSMAVESFRGTGLTPLGDGLLLAASFCWALYTVLLRRWQFPPIDTTIAITLLAAAIYLPIYTALLPKNLAATPWQECLAYGLYQGVVVAVVQMIFYTRAVALLGATRLAMLTSAVPVLAALSAVPVLGEPLTDPIILGLIFVVFGAFLGNRNADGKAPRPHP